MATFEDVSNLEASLREEMNQSKDTFTSAMDEIAKDVAELVAAIEKIEEGSQDRMEEQFNSCRNHTKSCCDDVHQELLTIQGHYENHLSGDLDALRQAVDELRDNALPSLGARMDADLKASSAEIYAAAAVQELKTTTVLQEQDRLREACEADCRLECGGIRGDYDKLLGAVDRSEARILERDAFHQASLIEAEARMTVRMEQCVKALEELAMKCDELNLDTRSETQSRVKELQSDFDGRVGAVEVKMSSFDIAVAEAASGSTRRIEWLIKGATRALLPDGSSATPDVKRWLSPKFEAAGALDMQLELQVIASGGPSATCDVWLSLWGPSGLSLVFKLFAGDSNVQLKHSFDGSSGCVPRQLASLADALNLEDRKSVV